MPVTAQEESQTLFIAPLANSDWQLRALYDERQVQAELLPGLIGRLALFLICATLATLALLVLQREQRCANSTTPRGAPCARPPAPSA